MRKEVLALALSVLILSSIFVPFRSVSAVHIDLDNTTIQQGGNTAIGLKITAQSPGAITFPSGDKNETIPNGEIRVTVDPGEVTEKIVTFDFEGHLITDNSAGAITGLTFAGITHGISNTAGSFGSGPYYGYGLIYHQTPNNFDTGQLGNGTLVTGISSKPYNEDTTGSYSINFDPTKLSSGDHHIRVDILAAATDTTMFSSGNIIFTNNSPSGTGTITVIKKIVGGSATLSDFVPLTVNDTEVTNGTATTFSSGLYFVNETHSASGFLFSFGTVGSAPGQFSNPNDVALDSSGNIYVTDASNDRVQKFDSSGNYLSQFGSHGSGDGQLNYPDGITIDSSNNIYVVDRENDRVQKFDSSGNYLSQFGTQGSGNGQFIEPHSIALDSSGNIYVTDSNHRVEKFDSSGNYLSQFGSFGSGNGQFNSPLGITIDSSGNIYVVDSGNGRVEKFDSFGLYLSQFGTTGSGNGQFNIPDGIIIDSSGNIYVADTVNNRIEKFDSNGNYLSQFGTFGSGSGQLIFPFGITIDSSGNLYVIDAGNSRVDKFGSTSDYTKSYSGDCDTNGFVTLNPDDSKTCIITNTFTGSSGGGTGNTGSLTVIKKIVGGTATLSDFIPLTVNDTEVTNGTATTFDTGHYFVNETNNAVSFLSSIGSLGSGNGQFYNTEGVAIDSSGNLYATDVMNKRVQKFDSSGNYLSQFGSPGSGNGEFSGPEDVAIDSSGNIYVLDAGPNSRVQKFDSSGNYLSQFGTFGTGNGQFNGPHQIAIDGSDNVYVIDDGNNRVQKFDSSGNYLSQFGTFGSGNGQFNLPEGIAVDSSGNIYVADTLNYRVQKFDSNGNYLSQFGTQGSGNGQFTGPSNISVDSSGFIYVTDTTNSRIEKFDSNGNYLSQFGTFGSGPGQFSTPQDVAIDSSGVIYVADAGNNRVEKFGPLDYVKSYSGDCDANGFVTINQGDNKVCIITNTFGGTQVAPTITLDSPLDGAIINSTHFTISGTVNDPNLDHVAVSIDNHMLTAILDTGSWSVDSGALFDGIHIVNATEYDTLGHNATSQTIHVTTSNIGGVQVFNNGLTPTFFTKGLAFVPYDTETHLYADNGVGMPITAQLQEINPNSGVLLSNVTMSVLAHTQFANGLATNPNTNELYGIFQITTQSGRELVKIDPTTGAITDIGNTGEKFSGIAFSKNQDNSVTLYGITGAGATHPNTLYTIDTTTAHATIFLAVSGPPSGSGLGGHGIAFNSDDKFMYHAWGTNPVGLEKINLSTKTITPIDVSATALLNQGQVFSMAYWKSEHKFLLVEGANLISLEVPIPAIHLDTTSGPSGTHVVITGSGFAPSHEITITYAGIPITPPGTIISDTSGGFTVAFDTPSSTPGDNAIVASDTVNSADATFTDTSSLGSAVITSSPSSGPIGTHLSITGTGFAPSTPILFTYDGVTFTPDQSVTSNSTGGFVGNFTVSSGTVGVNTISATDLSNTAFAQFVLSAQSISIDPSSGNVGAHVFIQGIGFTPNTPITFTFGGTPILPDLPVTSNSTGMFNGTITIPSSSPGSHEISASDGTVSATAQFTTLTSASIVIFSPSGSIGTLVTVFGTSFTPSVPLTITFDGKEVTPIVPAMSDSSGHFSITFAVPLDTTMGDKPITVTDGTKSATAIFTVTAGIAVNPTSGDIGQHVTVTGSGFLPLSPISFTFDSLPLVPDTPVTTNSSGAFLGTITIPISAPIGHSISASDGTNSYSALFFTNPSSSADLTVIKKIVGGTAVLADFVPLTANSTTVTNGTMTTLVNGTYFINETSSASGYTKSYSGDCSANGYITLNPGDEKTCIITNTFGSSTTLTVIKKIVNDNGGTATLEDFVPLTVNATTVTNGTASIFASGLYFVNETSNSGYAKSYSGDCNASGYVTLNPGDSKTCIITNNDIAPTMTVIKKIINNNGGTATVSDFIFRLNGTQVTNGTVNHVNAGKYTVSEDPHTGYHLHKGSLFGAFENDVLAAGLGHVSIYTKDGTLIKTITTSSGSGETTGMAVDKLGNLLVTEWTSNKVSQYDSSGNLIGDFGTNYNLHPESIAVNSNGHVFIGQADGGAHIREFDQSGNEVASYSVQREERGSDWIDLAVDGCTMYYTSEGNNVMRFNVCTNTQMSNFNTTPLPGSNAYALRLLQDGSVLVADTDRVVKLDPSGNDVKEYLAPGSSLLFAMNLDPDGTSFWTADIFHGQVYRFDIASGSLISQFVANGGTEVAGLLIGGELTSTATGIGGDCNPDGSIDLMPGENAVCTITNDDNGASITVIKKIVGGTATINNITLKLDGSEITNGTSNGVEVGPHQVTENTIPGYIATFGGDCLADGSITVGQDQDGVCFITNTFTAPTIPSITITNPVNDTLTSSSDVPVSGTASLSDGTITSVDYSVDGGSTTLASGTSSWYFTASGLTDGFHEVVVRAHGSNGQVATARVHFTVDATDPYLLLSNPTDGSTITSNHFTISGTASDANLDHVSVTIDGGTPIPATLSGTSWSVDSGTLADGPHTIVATAVDTAGNLVTETANITINTSSSITLDRAYGPPGQPVGVTGVNFAPNTLVHITLSGVSGDVATVTSDGTGGFSTSFTVPSSATFGPNTITAKDGTHTATASFGVAEAFISGIVPVGGSTGSMPTIFGSQFIANTPITILFNGVAVNAILSDNSGSFSTAFTVPPVSSGSYHVTATDGVNSASVLFAVGSSVTLNPTSGLQGIKTTISGQGFIPAVPLHIIFAGQHITLPNSQNSTKTGSFNVQVVVPSQADVGPNTVSVSDGVNSASATFTVPQPSITLSPDTGLVGSQLKIIGNNFVPNHPYFISFNGTTIKLPGTNSTGNNGKFTTTTFKVPQSSAGIAIVTVTDGTNHVSAPFTVHSAAITVTPAVGPQGTKLKIEGEGFTPSGHLTITFNGTNITPTPVPTASPSGKFSITTAKVPNTLGGTATITVHDDAATPLSDSKQFTVTPASLTLNPTSGLDNSKITVTGLGFAPNTPYHVSFNGTLVKISNTNKTNASGKISTSFNVPSSSPSGIATITVSDMAPIVSSVSKPFTVLPASLALAPTSGPVGTLVQITAAGFDAKVSYHVLFNGTLVNINKVNSTGTAGAFTASFNVPNSSVGTVTVRVYDDGTNHISVSQQFTVTPASLSVDPASALPGDTIKLTGAGFDAKSTFRISFNGTAIKLPGTNSTGNFGAFTASFKVPVMPVGHVTITVTDNGAGHISASTPFAIKPGFITLSPTSGVSGSTVKITAAGFDSNAKFFITFNGTTIKLPGANSTGNNGAFTASFKVPASSSGPVTITVHDNGVNHVTASAQFTVPQQSITLSPDFGPQQTEVTIQGAGFASSSSITLHYDSKDITPNNLKTDNKGAFKAKFKVPPSINLPHIVTATDASSSSAQGIFFKVPPIIFTSQDSGPAGTVISIQGFNFMPSQKITITSDGDPVTPFAPVKTNSDGSFVASLMIPSTEEPGASIVLTSSDGVNHTYQVFTISP